MDPAAGAGDVGPLLAGVGLRGGDVPHVVAVAAGSWQRLQAIRRSLHDVSIAPGIAVCAVGSLGRFEASVTSDVDLAVIYRGPTAEAATSVRATVA